MSEADDNVIADEGIDEGLKKLTPEKIQEVVNGALDRETAARMKIYLDTCVRCGLCSEGCHTFLSRNKDPLYAPVSKVKRTIWELVKNNGKVEPEVIREMARIAFLE